MRPKSYRNESPCCRNCPSMFMVAVNPGTGIITQYFCGRPDETGSESPAERASVLAATAPASIFPTDQSFHVWMGRHMVEPSGICDEHPQSKK